MGISLVPMARAGTVVWTNYSGYWSVPYNWSPNHVPGPADTAVIASPSNGAPYSTVSLDMNANVGSLIVGDSGNIFTLYLNGYTLSFSNQLTVVPGGSFTLYNGALYGSSSAATLSGAMAWWNGSISGWFTVGTNAQLGIGLSGDHNLPGCIFTNNGTVVWNGGRVRGGGLPGTTFNNNGVWNCQADLVLNNDYAGDGTVFNNAGTYWVSAGTNGSTFSGVPFYSTGTVAVDAGALVLSSGGGFTGGSVTGAGALDLTGGYFNLAGTALGTNSWLAGASLYGANLFSGRLYWSSGNWNSAGAVTLATNSELDIVSVADHDLAGCNFTNNGTVEWWAGRVRGGGLPGSTIANHGLWEAQCDYALNADYAGVGLLFNNSGIFRKSATSGTTTLASSGGLGVTFNSIGWVDVESGGLSLACGGSGASFNTATNASLGFSGGCNFPSGTTFTGPGVVAWNAGTFTVNGALNFQNLQQNGGTLAGNNVLLNGAFTWNGGNWNAASVVTLSPNSLLNIAAAADHDLAGCVFTNNGTVEWLAGRVRGGGLPGSTLINNGLWEAQCDQVINADYAGDGTAFYNSGTFRKAGGIAATTLAGSFNSTGTTDVRVGTVGLSAGGIFSGGAVTGNGTLQLTAGYYNFAGTSLSTNVWEVGGSLYGANTLLGGLTWSSGNWDSASAVTLATNSELDIVSVADHDLASCTFTNCGRVEWLGGRVRGGGNPATFIINSGLWEVQCDYALNADFGVNGTVFQNSGVFRKINTTGNTLFNPSAGLGTRLLNPGSVDIESGSLTVAGGGEGLDFTAATNTTVNFSGGYSFDDGATLGGAGSYIWSAGGLVVGGRLNFLNLEMTGGTLSGGNIVLNGPFTWYGGNWDGAAAVTIPTNASLSVISGNDHDLASCTLSNLGTVFWTGGRLRGGSYPGTVIDNFGLWNAQCDQVINSDLAYYGTIFNNWGTFQKTVTAGNTTLSASSGLGTVFNNSGTVNLATGALVLTGGGVFTGGTVTGAMYLSGGYYNFTGTLLSTNVQEVGGFLYGNNVLNGGFTWSSGNWNSAGSVTLPANSELDVVSGADHDLASCVFNNSGDVEWRGGRVRGGSNPGTIINNWGVWDAQCDQPINCDYALNGLVFANNGLFKKSASYGTTTFAPSGGLGLTYIGTNGAVEVDGGTLVLPNYTAYVKSVTIGIGGSGAGQAGQLAVAGSLYSSGALTVNVLNGYQPPVGTQFKIISGFPFGTFASSIPDYGTLLFTNIYSPGITLAIAGIYFDVISPPPVQIINPQFAAGTWQFSFQTVSNQSYTVWENTNLVSTWVPITNFTGAGTPWNFSQATTNSPQAFFRVSEP